MNNDDERLKYILDSVEYQNMSDEEKIIILNGLEKNERFINLVEDIYADIFPEQITHNKKQFNKLGRIESFTLLIYHENGIRTLQSEFINTYKKNINLLKELDTLQKSRLIMMITGNRDMRGIKF